MDRRGSGFLVSTVVLILALVAQGCAPQTPAPPPAPQTAPTSAPAAPAPTSAGQAAAPTQPAAKPAAAPAGQKTLTIGQVWSATTLEPHLGSQELQTKRIAGLIFDTLVKFSFDESSGRLSLVPGLATAWKAIDDTTWELTLRQGVKFHNGEDFNADAVKVSVERLIDPQAKGGYVGYVSQLSGIEVVNPTTVRLKTKTPYPTLPQGLATAVQIVPPKYLQEVGDQAFGLKPVGSGPFKFVEMKPNDSVTLEANPAYWDGAPKLDRVVFKLIPDDATRVAALKAGEIQVAFPIPADAAQEIKAGGQQILPSSGLLAYAVDFNENRWNDSPLSDVKVRQALNYAVDKETILNRLFRGYGSVLSCQIPTRAAFGFNASLKPYPFDQNKAKGLLDEAGWQPGSDGIRVNAAGKRLSLVYSVRNGYYQPDVATAVSSYLKDVGVEIKLNLMEEGLFQQSRREEKLDDMIGSAWAHFGDASQALVWYTQESSLGVYHRDPRINKLIMDAGRTVDQQKRQELYGEATQIMCDEGFAIFLFELDQLWGMRQNVTGFKVLPPGWLDLSKTDLS